jgi:hypothetical protein
VNHRQAEVAHSVSVSRRTKFFHLHASGRRRKKFVPSLSFQGRTVHGEEEKAGLAYDFFNSLIGEAAQRSHSLDFDFLGLPSLDLSSLEDPFTEEEVERIIKALPSDKAPGPDGFTGPFPQDGVARYQGRCGLFGCLPNTPRHATHFAPQVWRPNRPPHLRRGVAPKAGIQTAP